jgi:hypothetical protein
MMLAGIFPVSLTYLRKKVSDNVRLGSSPDQLWARLIPVTIGKPKLTMNSSITLNSKVFNKTKNPNSTAVVFTTRSRGADLPDDLLVSHKSTPNLEEEGTVDVRSVVQVARTYKTADGITKTVIWQLQAVIPDDAIGTDVDAALADLTDFMASAITLRAANIAAITNHEIA